MTGGCFYFRHGGAIIAKYLNRGPESFGDCAAFCDFYIERQQWIGYDNRPKVGTVRGSGCGCGLPRTQAIQLATGCS